MELDLSRNNIDDLKAFAGLTSLGALTTLNLSGNQIHSLNGLCLGGLTHLSELKLANNDFKGRLPMTTFANCVRLRALDLSGNKLISAHCVKRLPSLTTLHLSHNRIESLDGLPACRCLNAFECLNAFDCLNAWMLGCLDARWGALPSLRHRTVVVVPSCFFRSVQACVLVQHMDPGDQWRPAG